MTIDFAIRVIEYLHVLTKREWLNQLKIKDYEHTYRLIFEYIETFYHTTTDSQLVWLLVTNYVLENINLK